MSNYDFISYPVSSNLLGICVILSQIMSMSRNDEKLNSPHNNKLISWRSFTEDCANSESCCSVSWSIALATIDLGM